MLKKNAIIEYGELPSIEGSSILIFQLFYNLTEAATHKELKKYRMELKENKYIRVTIQDNGIGFSDNEADQIFKTFSRLHSKDKYEGSGLGLALCKKIVERHGGAISASGVENEGSSFEIILPVKQKLKVKDGSK